MSRLRGLNNWSGWGGNSSVGDFDPQQRLENKLLAASQVISDSQVHYGHSVQWEGEDLLIPSLN